MIISPDQKNATHATHERVDGHTRARNGAHARDRARGERADLGGMGGTRPDPVAGRGFERDTHEIHPAGLEGMGGSPGSRGDPPVLDVAGVAALLQRRDPTSAAAAAFVGRLVKKGLPCLPHTRPRRFLRSAVLRWIEAESSADPAQPARPRRARRRRPARAGSLDAAIAELEEDLG